MYECDECRVWEGKGKTGAYAYRKTSREPLGLNPISSTHAFTLYALWRDLGFNPGIMTEWSSYLTTNHEIGVRFSQILKFKMWIRSGTGSTQPREDNWVAT